MPGLYRFRPRALKTAPLHWCINKNTEASIATVLYPEIRSPTYSKSINQTTCSPFCLSVCFSQRQWTQRRILTNVRTDATQELNSKGFECIYIVSKFEDNIYTN